MASKTGKSSGKSTGKAAGKTPGKSTGKASGKPVKGKTPAKAKGRSGPDPVTGATRAMFRAEVLGIGLVLLAAFTLLALLSNSRSQVTGGWLGFLRGLFGAGVWWAPLVLGVLGVWLIVRAVERMPNLPWQRPAGFLLLFAAFIAGAALLVAPDERAVLADQGSGGGQIGALLADVLQGSVGTGAAWALLTLLCLAGIALLADRLLVDGWYALSDWGQRQGDGIRGARYARPATASANAIRDCAVVEASLAGTRHRRSFRPQCRRPAPNLVRPDASAPPPVPSQVGRRLPSPASSRDRAGEHAPPGRR